VAVAMIQKAKLHTCQVQGQVRGPGYMALLTKHEAGCNNVSREYISSNR
jgi:hypothetical protein